ncbi:hypothetical protein FQN49_004200 [Arthroderma sp. PD_2]|nr:hypothetical protein FQN49_004200 [Arthroderma sp. PD_2]
MALQFDRARGEPYLTVPTHPNIIIAPHRLSDGDALVGMLNDYSIAKWLHGPPYPFALKDTGKILKMAIERTERIMSEMENDDSQSEDGETKKRFFRTCPLNTIREIQPETGEQKLIGCMGIKKDLFLEIQDDAEREKLSKANEAKEVGDETILWTMGNFISPSYQGRGITTAVARVMIEWGREHLNMKNLRVSIFEGNIGSRKVYEKVGFVYHSTAKDAMTRVEIKGGGKITLDIFHWKGS